MMNGGGQPSMPMHSGRGGQHEMPYNPQHHGPYPPQPYNQHPQHFRQPYYQQPPQQWAYYPGMQPMYRPYPHQHQAMMGAPYPIPQIPQSMSPRPGQHMPQHTPTRPVHIYSPPPPERPMHQLPPTPTQSIPPTLHPAPVRRTPWYPPLPWYSDPSTPFPPAARKRKRQFAPQSPSIPVELPPRGVTSVELETNGQERPEHQVSESLDLPTSEAIDELPQPSEDMESLVRALPVALEVTTSETPATSQAPSENNSTQPTTPSSTQPPRSAGSNSTVRAAGKVFPVIPVVPHIPGLAKSRRKESVSTLGETTQSTAVSEVEGTSTFPDAASISNEVESTKDAARISEPEPQTPTQKAAPPKSWADLVRSKASAAQQNAPLSVDVDPSHINGGGGKSSLAELLKKFSLSENEDNSKLSFVKPRGLINTGNMCYMNGILQVLLYCTPFYNFLDKVSKNASYSFKSETPMIDAMILFTREFPVIDAASSPEQLRLRLKNEELEQYGEPFTPELVYEVIRRLPRFSSMRRGHQQDAEEFLGFLLEEMHEECVRAMKGLGPTPFEEIISPVTEASQPEDGWLEVGPKQKAAITRSSGHVSAESPITKIFGGKLRSEFRVPGTKNSVTLEPYQPLQLDIGSPHINNIVDALKGLTRSEVIHGDFNSPRGPGVSATKQVFIETLPPVLILHLKRFQYDNTGGTQKIWKKVGYPLELEIPKEVFPQHKRGSFAVKGGLPKYRLISVVYHHGKSASGGHYTVDVRRQDGLEWIRLDDTVIRRVRSEDVAEGGSEEDPKILAAALEQHKRDQSSSSNIFDQVREEQEQSAEAEKGWSHVNGSSHGGSTSKKWSGVVNGTATPTVSSGKRTPVNKFSVKDNKVAYILFYQRIGA